MRKTGYNPRRPGVMAAASVALILGVCFYAFNPGVDGGRAMELRGLFSQSLGLAKGAPIRVAGVDVGEVTDIGRGPGNTAEVTFALNKDAPPLYEGTTLRLRPRLFIEGGFYIQLSPGVRGAARRLEDGDTIALPRTSVTVANDQVLSVNDKQARRSQATIVKEIATALGTGGAADVRAILRQGAPVLRDQAIVSRASQGVLPGEVGSLVQQSAAVAEALGGVTSSIERYVVDFERTIRVYAQEAPTVRRTIRALDRTLAETPRTLRVVDRSLPLLERYNRLARPVFDRLPRSLRSTVGVLRQTLAVSRDDAAPRLLRTLAPTIQRIPTLTRRQRPLLEHTTPVAECMSTKITPILDAKLDDGRHSSGRPVYLDAVHAATSAAGAGQNFDGNGPYLRYEAGITDRVVSTGELPGVGTLVGLTDSPVLGSRPAWNGPTPPPFHPEADCRDQALPSLSAKAVTLRTTPVRLSARERSHATRLLRRLRKAGDR